MHHNSTPYRPKANGAVEAANKNIKKILRKMVQGSRQWQEKLPFALFGYRTSVGATPYLLVYGTEAVIPAEVEIPSLRIIVEAEIDDTEWVKSRLEQLSLIDEKRLMAVCFGQLNPQRMARTYNRKVRPRHFEVGQLVMKRILPHQEEARGKFAPNWQAPMLSNRFSRKHKIDIQEWSSISDQRKEERSISKAASEIFLVESDAGIRTLQSSLSSEFCVLQFFAVDESEDNVSAPNIIYHKEPCFVSVDVGTDCESGEEEDDDNESVPSDCDSEELELFRKEKNREVNEKLDRFLVLEKGMSFKDLDEAKRVVSYYAVSNKKGLKVDHSDSHRVRYKCDSGCPFVCLISEDNKNQRFKIKTMHLEHNCQPAFKNRRATQQALAHYFKNKVQNNPKYKVKDMRQDLDDQFSRNISASKMKRVKRLILEKLEGSYLDDFNRLEAYAQELRDSNPGTDVVINVSKEALEQGKRRFLRMYVCFQALKSSWRGGLRPFIGLDGIFLKGKCRGILLVALGQDSQKHFYPLAWAVVDRETSRTWK
ncbi:uncharacterized protein LOC132624104 [Lycium barbarum]|uniref:uncharacterized protein LOC132624104 n=1 Tax=Lycium barbarum TaxID=112863 RepID=UPI00293E9E37|nr:uncharacterized protein LOC132624104 [Lycium barbarum]